MTEISIDTRIELAIGADLTASPLSWTWTDITRRTTPGSRTTVYQQEFSLTRGRADESSQASPSSITFTVDNPDGALTPRRPTSPFWPNAIRGTPCRVSILGDLSHLALSGTLANFATTVDHATLDIVGDLDLRVFATSSGSWRQSRVLAGKYDSVGNQRSWLIGVKSDGTLILWWSPDGTSLARRQIESSAPMPTAPRTAAVRVVLDVDNGSGGITATFFTAPAPAGPWTQLGDPVSASGTTSIHAGTAPIRIGYVSVGSIGGVATAPWDGKVHAVEVRNGIGGPAVTSPDFTAQAPGTTAFADAQGRPWTLAGGAEITNRHVRFVGQINAVRPRRATGNIGHSEVDIDAAGITRRLSQGAKSLDSAIRRRVMSSANVPSLLAYWPCEDGRDATTAASPLDGVPPMSMAGFRFASEDTIAASMPLPRIDSGTGAFSGSVPPPSAPLTSWSVEFFCRIETLPSAPFLVFAASTAGTVRQWRVFLETGFITVAGVNADGVAIVTSVSAIGSGSEFTDQPVMFRLDVTQDGADVDWELLWVPLNGSHVAFGVSGTRTSATLGRPTAVQSLFASAPPDGFAIGHIIVQSGLVFGWLAQAEIAFQGEAAGTRFLRLCAEEGVLSQVTGDPADTEPMGPQRPLPFLELLRECAVADGGILGEPRDQLALAYRTRSSMYNQPPAIELDHAAGHIIPPFEPTDDDQRFRNEITVERPAGSSVRLVDQDSIDASGAYDDLVPVNVAADDQLLHQAAWRLHIASWPEMRYPGVTPDLAFHPDNATRWLDTEEGDLIRVVNQPPEWPPGDVDLIVEGSTDTWDRYHWRPAINASPGGPWHVGVLDTDSAPDLELATLDTDASELAADIDTDDLLLAVVVTDGPLWTTAGDQFPLDIEIGGERITLSGISGASSPQTFTVAARAVNGVTKAHAAGEAVQVADPFRLAF